MQHLELAEEALMCPECFCLASPEEIDGVLRCAICLTPTPIRQENAKEEERKEDFEVTADGARVSIFMPAELLDLIFSFLPFKTELLPSISCVNRVFRQLVLSRLTPPESFRRTASPERLIKLLKFLGDHSSPRFLKHLNLSRCEALTSTELQHIPPSITSLNLSSCEYLLCSSIGCLPPNIKKVDISSCSGIYLDLAIPQLPENLKGFTLNPQVGKCAVRRQMRVSSKTWESLPRRLTYLDVDGFDEAAVPTLPTTLKTLKLFNCSVDGHKGNINFPNLTYLDCRAIRNLDTEAALPALKTLVAGGISDITSLPHVTSLESHSVVNPSYVPNVTHLRLRLDHMITIPNCLRSLHELRKLIFLKLYLPDLSQSLDIRLDASQIFDDLPEWLQILDISNWLWPTTLDLQSLPSGLTTLYTSGGIPKLSPKIQVIYVRPQEPARKEESVYTAWY